MWRFLRQQLQRTAPATAAVLAGDVVPELVGVCLGEEVRSIREALRVEELPLDGAVHRLDIGIGVGTMRRVEFMLRSPLLFDGADETVGSEVDGIAIELGTEVGADFDLAQVNTVSGQVCEEAVDGQCCIGLGEFVAVGEELGADAALADGGLETWESLLLHLGPVHGQIGEVFGVHAETGEGLVSGFDGAQITFGLVTTFGFTCQAMDAEDAVDGVVAEGQTELGDEATCAKARSLAAEDDDFLFERRVGFVWAGMGCAALSMKSLEVLVAVTAEPLADGVAGTTEVGGGGAQTVLEGMEDEVVAQSERGIGGADHGVVRYGVVG